MKHENQEILIISIYVDDILVTGSNDDAVRQFKMQMREVFEMNDLGEMSYFLSMKIKQTSKGIFISQRKYAGEILKKFEIENNKFVSTPAVQREKLKKEDGSSPFDSSIYRSLVGCLLYLCGIRPNILFATSVLSRFMHSPTELHFKVVKSVLRYI